MARGLFIDYLAWYSTGSPSSSVVLTSVFFQGELIADNNFCTVNKLPGLYS